MLRKEIGELKNSINANMKVYNIKDEHKEYANEWWKDMDMH